MYAAVAQMTPVLRDRLATSPIRAVYELHQMWKKFPQAVESFCAEHGSFTRAQAIAFSDEPIARSSRIDGSSPSEAAIGAARPHGDEGSPGAERKVDCAPQGDGSGELGRNDPSGYDHDEASREPARPARRDAASRMALVTLRVEHGERSGRLMLDRGSSKDETHGLVLFEDDGAVEDLPLAALTLVAMKRGVSSP